MFIPTDDRFCSLRSEKIDLIKNKSLTYLIKVEDKKAIYCLKTLFELRELLEREVYLRSIKIQGN